LGPDQGFYLQINVAGAADVARRMKTSQSYIARIEGGKVRPSTDARERFAHATRTRLRIVFEPAVAR